ncbi:hypothetical protein F442_08605 [Phytophthora nicotianae P10297]|uniref:Uncharacterized protein n=1 Tax=Phytophthora nicotianae P10297 TaxID=1317064 RepID=W2ZCZ6_PHYNI|nr:hypothetical protein F442_08605 [Phytophthora nicotianae P10297]
MIRATRIDPVAVEHHVNSKLQSAIRAVNDVAQTQARAVVEAHSAQHAQVNDMRMTQALESMEDRLRKALEERMQELVAVRMEHLEAEIRLAIVKQGEEILPSVGRQIVDVQQQTAAQLEFVKTCAEKKAKSIVPLHHAEENSAHKAIRLSLLATMKEYKAAAVASAARYADDLIRSLGDVKSSDSYEGGVIRQVKSHQVATSDGANMLLLTSSEATSKPPTCTSRIGSSDVGDGEALDMPKRTDVQDTKATSTLVSARLSE